VVTDRLTVDQLLDGWLRLRTDQPDLSGVEIAERLGVTDGRLRGVVQRAAARDDPRAVPGRGNVGRPRGVPIPFDPYCTLDEGEQS
jgi:hypothetical protein